MCFYTMTFSDIGDFLVEHTASDPSPNFSETSFTSDDFRSPENFILLALRIVFNSGTEKVREIDVIIFRTSSATQLVYFLAVFPRFNALKQTQLSIVTLVHHLESFQHHLH